ncbi:ABC transporter permease [Saccharothrix sp. Mg75]|uniref:ABC transporter permease n=1 Tax=Saccharothrix sp. Mg75 TaxID=3445357 RepID=UPI003EEF8044
MLRTILAGLRARTARLVLSSVAIALGVAFVTGTLVLGDAMNESLRDQFAKGARNVDLSVTPATRSEGTEGITPEVLEKVRATPGVAGADPRYAVPVPLIGGDGKAKNAWGVPLATTEELREFDLVDGRYPTGDDEIAVDERTAKTADLAVGEPVTLLGDGDRERVFRVVGTYTQGVSQVQVSGTDHVVLTADALRSFDPEQRPYEVVVAAAPGVTQQQVLDDVRAAIGGTDFGFRTGEQLTEETLRSVASQAAEFTSVLLVFALIALIVAAMVIYNTFTILVAQRTRELALMRCVGASRGQVFRGVLAEALVMGLVASVLGLVAGLGVSALLQQVIGSIGDGGGAPVRLPVAPTTVLAAFAVGTLVTVLAAVLPARKATRVAPVAALRSQPDSGEEVKRTGVLRVLTAGLFAAVGVTAVVVGVGIDGEEASMLVSGAGTMALLAAVIVLGPLLVGPVNRVLGVLPRALFGVPAKLASANAGRNPRRTAATTAALIIGVTIVALVTVVANSAKETANAQIDQRMPADYTVTSSVYDRSLPQGLADDLAKVPEVEAIAPTTAVYGDRAYFTGIPRDAVGDLFRPVVKSGSLADLADGTVAVRDEYATQAGLSVGSTLTVEPTEGGETQSLRVIAVVSGNGLSDGLMTLETSRRFPRATEGYDSILIKLRDGAANGREAVEKVTDASPLAVLDSAAETKAQLNRQLDQVLGFIWALIGLAVVIALFGIANTLTLSVLERTRESALLRALGLTRGQLRLMLVVESVLMAVMGAAIGLVLGVGFGWVVVEAASTDTVAIDLVVPFGQIGVMLAGAVVAAVLAAALPARRAARTSVIAGIAEA